MIKESLIVGCKWCGKPCGELPMSSIGELFITLHQTCYSELILAYHRLQGLEE